MELTDLNTNVFLAKFNWCNISLLVACNSTQKVCLSSFKNKNEKLNGFMIFICSHVAEHNIVFTDNKIISRNQLILFYTGLNVLVFVPKFFWFDGCRGKEHPWVLNKKNLIVRGGINMDSEYHPKENCNKYIWYLL